eukprot:TRINITY_DN3415_c0_g1_i1.p1 TRINITY_DN3415_c0_g1~~TRINITY_DN3415_c0_g1_i1.p1  ORF type:complete len:461 (+),score=71.39 TRINITY_DN3415_c0_g1_i1:20-1402(+)
MASRQPFQGFKFYSHSRFSFIEKRELIDGVELLGGEICNMLTPSVTHFICPSVAKDSLDYHVVKAKQKKKQVVDIAWLRQQVSEFKSHSKSSIVKSTAQKSNESEVSLITQAITNINQATLDLTTSSSISPTISEIVPTGPVTGNIRVAIFGFNFIPSPKFRIKFGNVVAFNYQFHSSTSVLCTIPECKGAAGEVTVCASNDGETYGFPNSFTFYDVDSTEIYSLSSQKFSLLSGQLRNVNQAIASIQKMEMELRRELKKMSGDEIIKLAREGGIDLPALTGVPSNLRASNQRSHQGNANRRSVDDREIRIFLSSPFRDMQSERDLIMKLALPQLRRLCLERDVVLSCVDLRWGVTEAQSNAAATLLMCLREIEKCNAFIGMWGERYGWCTSEKGKTRQDELLKRAIEVAEKEFPWISEYTNRSVTEIEMRMVLNHKHSGSQKPSWWYLRDPYLLNKSQK